MKSPHRKVYDWFVDAGFTTGFAYNMASKAFDFNYKEAVN